MFIKEIDHRPNPTVTVVVILLYNLLLLAGVSYLVFWHNASAWLYVLALLFGASWKSDQEAI